MSARKLLATLAVAVAVACAFSAPAVARPNAVATSRAGTISVAIGVNDVKPDDCAALALTTLVTGSGNFTGTAGNDLILASAVADTVAAGDGADCVLGGGGDDTLRGGAGIDVCIGGPGIDSFTLVGANACETAVQ